MKLTSKLLSLMLMTGCLILLVSSCDKNNSTGSVDGKITLSDPQNPEMFQAVKGLTVYLLDAEKIRSEDSEFYLDSTITDEEGLYEFTGLADGDFAVFPSDNDQMYRFEPADSDSVYFTIREGQKQFTIDFNAVDPIPDNDQFTIRLKAINMNMSSIVFGDFKYVIERYYKENIFETKIQVVAEVDVERFLLQDVSLSFNYGFTTFFWSLTNEFRITVYEQGEMLPYGYISLPIMNCPASSTWIVDWDTGNIVRE